ncbi:transcription elongation factor GreA [Miniphocaeibacter halophilus]|uniref:Transcription elongation factor GreA n=1 Tax=Miniphocaeibacter halophilus TaxID=2931922 RepID=A0AC61MQJ2_9FIRM|nr:transcription elongation factor GreA [Miniphocaeibacter halophilus]QQK07932.1 transcription elongation factor GreA [Miniphocaeibacter halophilus]
MSEKEFLLTKEGYNKLEDELEFLKTVRRKEVADKIKVARGFGDLSENAEYDEAKNEQAQVEDRILVLEHMLINAKIIDESEIKTDAVGAGSTIILKDLSDGEIDEYTIVGSAESDPFNGKISNESPVGQACIGMKKGDKVTVVTNGGTFNYEIMEIKR